MNDDILKDVVLSTLAELEDDVLPNEEIETSKKEELNKEISVTKETIIKELANESEKLNSLFIEEKEVVVEEPHQKSNIGGELEFINSIQEEIELLFKGLKSKELVEPEKKKDLVVKYLQNLLFMLGERANKLQKS